MTVDDSSVGLRVRRPVVSRINGAVVVVDCARRIIELIGRHHADRIAIRTVRIGEKSGHCHQCRQELRVRHIRQVLGYRKRRGELDVVEMGRDDESGSDRLLLFGWIEVFYLPVNIIRVLDVDFQIFHDIGTDSKCR